MKTILKTIRRETTQVWVMKCSSTYTRSSTQSLSITRTARGQPKNKHILSLVYMYDQHQVDPSPPRSSRRWHRNIFSIPTQNTGTVWFTTVVSTSTLCGYADCFDSVPSRLAGHQHHLSANRFWFFSMKRRRWPWSSSAARQ